MHWTKEQREAMKRRDTIRRRNRAMAILGPMFDTEYPMLLEPEIPQTGQEQARWP